MRVRDFETQAHGSLLSRCMISKAVFGDKAKDSRASRRWHLKAKVGIATNRFCRRQMWSIILSWPLEIRRPESGEHVSVCYKQPSPGARLEQLWRPPVNAVVLKTPAVRYGYAQ